MKFLYVIRESTWVLKTQPVFITGGAVRTRWASGPYLVHAAVVPFDVAIRNIETQEVFAVPALQAVRPMYPQPNLHVSAHNVLVYPSAVPELVRRNRSRKSEIIFRMNCIPVMIKIQFIYQMNPTNTIRLILCRKIIRIYCEGHTGHVSAECGQIWSIWILLCGTYCNVMDRHFELNKTKSFKNFFDATNYNDAIHCMCTELYSEWNPTRW
jgi:hypothetical protein